MNNALTATCHCGAVSVTIPRKPDYVNDCNCSLCRKAGAAWGYFEATDCNIHGPLAAYARTDIAEPTLQLNFCPQCSAVTHWSLLTDFAAMHPSKTRIGVNMRLFIDTDFSGVELRFENGKDWAQGKPLTSRKAPITLTADDAF